MTHSYAMRAWTMAQMSLRIFGRETIACAAGISPRTISTWLRQEEDKLPYSNKMPKEYERGMGVVLARYFPHLIGEISKSLRSPERSIREWIFENRTKPFSSDLRIRTFEGVAKLELLVNPNLNSEEALEFIYSWNKWPDAEWLYRSTWRELDSNLEAIINIEADRWYINKFGTLVPDDSVFLENINRRILVGPHVNRHAIKEYGLKPVRDVDFLRKRIVGRFRDGGLSAFRERSGATSYLTLNRPLEAPKFYLKEFEKFIIQEEHYLLMLELNK